MKTLSLGSWTDEIAAVTTSDEYQNAEIEIRDSKIRPTYDIETDEYTYPDNVDLVLYSGKARIKPIRWDVFLGGEGQSNAKTIAAIRVQIPKNGVGRLTLGDAVYVTQCDDHPTLEGAIFNVSSGMQGSHQASRTFEAAADSDYAYAGDEDVFA